MAEGLEPAWVLHRRSYGDNGLLIELLGLTTGRFSAVVRGARRKAHGGSVLALLQPFSPLLVVPRGRAELKSLHQLESAGPRLPLSGLPLLSGLYLNELLIRVLPRFDAHPSLFADYGTALECLSAVGPSSSPCSTVNGAAIEGGTTGLPLPAEEALRRFELALLTSLGYALEFDRDSDGDLIEDPFLYTFDPAFGFQRCVFSETEASLAGPGRYGGGQLRAIDQWLSHHTVLDEDCRHPLKTITRVALAVLLGDKPLRARQLARQHMAMAGGTQAKLALASDQQAMRLSGEITE